MSAPRVLFAGLFHETHTFLDETTGFKDFEISRGEELTVCKGDSSPMGGALEFAFEQGWSVTPMIDYRAVPGGTVEDEVFDSFWNEFEAAWNPDVDALFLVLHGAMCTRSIVDVEGELLTRIRKLPGGAELPVIGVYDLHANFSPAMAEHADALLAYRENPHTDARAAAVRAAELLQRYFETATRPVMTFASPGLIWPPTGVATASDPMKSLEATARELELADARIWGVNVTAGFGFADTPDTGVSFQVIADPDLDVTPQLNRLCSEATDMRAAGHPKDRPIAEVIPDLKKPVGGLTVLVEPSDNIGGGAPGDVTGCLRALVENSIERCAVAINDTAAVQQLTTLNPGDRIKVPIGGRGSRFDAGPLELEVELVSLSDGRFELEDKQSHLASLCGDHFNMGPTAVVKCGGVTILLTTHRTPPFDLGQWRSQGIDPETLSVIVVKAAVAHRRAYDPITARSFTVDTPGPCSSNLSSFDYQFARAACTR
ncbi:MAG: M81 family metallopeptidase [Verrucomicrobiia bacterium]|jgi:microcystin degradation protein MlrC